MSSVVRRWIRTFCSTCGERTVFEVRVEWTFVCTKCTREERGLTPSGLLQSA